MCEDNNSVSFLEAMARFFESRDTGGEDMAHWANVYNAENCRKIASTITQLRAERDDRKEQAAAMCEIANNLRNEIAYLKKERDDWKSAAKSAGVCMSCARGSNQPCTDCLGTGWVGGAPAGYVEQEMLKEARRNTLEEAAKIADDRADKYEKSRIDELSIGKHSSAFESEYARDICKSFADAIRALAKKGNS